MTTPQVLRISAQDLQRRAEEHQRLIIAALEGGSVSDMSGVCSLLDCPHKRKVKETIVETITVLEETRKAFKSSQLEALRKKLIRVLAEEA